MKAFSAAPTAVLSVSALSCVSSRGSVIFHYHFIPNFSKYQSSVRTRRASISRRRWKCRPPPEVPWLRRRPGYFCNARTASARRGAERWAKASRRRLCRYRGQPTGYGADVSRNRWRTTTRGGTISRLVAQRQPRSNRHLVHPLAAFRSVKRRRPIRQWRQPAARRIIRQHPGRMGRRRACRFAGSQRASRSGPVSCRPETAAPCGRQMSHPGATAATCRSSTTSANGCHSSVFIETDVPVGKHENITLALAAPREERRATPISESLMARRKRAVESIGGSVVDDYDWNGRATCRAGFHGAPPRSACSLRVTTMTC